jgi:hypothetical protein
MLDYITFGGLGLEEIMEQRGHKDDDVTKSVHKKEVSHKFNELVRNLFNCNRVKMCCYDA